jgi:hypothetical protein
MISAILLNLYLSCFYLSSLKASVGCILGDCKELLPAQRHHNKTRIGKGVKWELEMGLINQWVM